MDEKILSEILTEIKSMKEDMGIIKSNISTMQQDINHLKEDVTIVKSDIKEIKQDIRDINLDIFKIMARDSNTEQAKKMELVFNALDDVYGKKKN